MFYVVVHQRRLLRKWKRSCVLYRESSLSELMQIFGAWIPFFATPTQGGESQLSAARLQPSCDVLGIFVASAHTLHPMP